MSLRRCLLLFLLLTPPFAAPVFAGSLQIPGLSPTQNGQQKENQPPADPYGRENPRGTILGFIRAAQEGKTREASEYFQPALGRRRLNPEDEDELPNQLLAILNQKLTGPLDFISRDPQGRLDDGLPPDQEKISVGPDFTLLLVRSEDSQGRKLWYISRPTLEQVPREYDSLQFPELEKHIPRPLVDNRLLGMPVWQWLAVLLFIPIALALARILTIAAQIAHRRWNKARGRPLPVRQPIRRLGPVTLAIAVILHYRFVASIGTSVLYRLYYRRIIWIFLAFAFYWALTHITRTISERIGSSLSKRGLLAERSIVSLIRRFIEVSIFLFVLLTVLRTFGVDVTTALAGVGIGGLALGLGAQKTFENVFGGVSILFDRVVQIGDVCKIADKTGVIEDIGLRSTRLRTADRTLLSIPNGTLATATIENLRFRDKFLCQQTIRLRYDLAPDHVRYVLNEIRELMRKNPKIEENSARVRLLRFAEYALEVEIFCYILESDYVEFLATQEALFLQIMDVLEQTGAVLATSNQMTLMKDVWVDPEKSKVAQAALEKTRDRGVPGPQNSPKPL